MPQGRYPSKEYCRSGRALQNHDSKRSRDKRKLHPPATGASPAYDVEVEGQYPQPPLLPNGQVLTEFRDVGSEEEEDLPPGTTESAEMEIDAHGRTIYPRRGRQRCPDYSSSEDEGSETVGKFSENWKGGKVSHLGQRCGVRRTGDEAYEQNEPLQRLVRQRRESGSPSSSRHSANCEARPRKSETSLPAAGKPTGALGPFENEEDPRASPRGDRFTGQLVFDSPRACRVDCSLMGEDHLHPQSKPIEDPESLGAAIAKHFCAICSEYTVQHKDGVNRHRCPPGVYAPDGH